MDKAHDTLTLEDLLENLPNFVDRQVHILGVIGEKSWLASNSTIEGFSLESRKQKHQIDCRLPMKQQKGFSSASMERYALNSRFLERNLRKRVVVTGTPRTNEIQVEFGLPNIWIEVFQIESLAVWQRNHP